MKVGLFIPCYVNTLYPEVGVATYKLLTHLGVEVDYPLNQTCCGQPMANGGFEKDSLPLAHHFEETFGDYEYIVAPSASCTVFVKENYPRLFEKEGLQRESKTSKHIYDVCEFLHDILKVKTLPSRFPHKVSIHNSCHGVRELHLSSPSELNIPKYSKIRNLLSLVNDIEILEPARVDECCGFGGMFSIEEESVSACMGQDKIEAHKATGAEFITGADSSCLMHMQGLAKRNSDSIKFIHVVQILAAGL